MFLHSDVDAVHETATDAIKEGSRDLARQPLVREKQKQSLALEPVWCEDQLRHTAANHKLMTRPAVPIVMEVGLSLTHTLLTYYVANVADILVPVNHPQNPFRSIHLQFETGIGADPSHDGLKYTSKPTRGSKNSILCSLVSTAAFHLREQDGVESQLKTKLDQIGREYHVKAIGHLRDALASPSSAFETHYLKVSAILTLVTSNVGLICPPAVLTGIVVAVLT
jgi:hypothetical protein